MHERELQIQIDDVYACPGNCPGCILSTRERRQDNPDMSLSDMQRIGSAVLKYALSSPTRYDRINITLGIADHFAVDLDHLIGCHEILSDVIRSASPSQRDYSAVFFTTALIGKRQKLEDAISRLADSVGTAAVPLIPVVVMDPVLMNRSTYSGDWKYLASHAKKKLGKIDLTINLSAPAIEAASPFDVIEFSVRNGFDEITLNWVPTEDNRLFTMSDLEKLVRWIEEFRAKAQASKQTASYIPVLKRSLDAAMCSADSDEANGAMVLTHVHDVITQTVSRSLHIDHKGNLYPKFEAIGDISQGDRHGYRPLGNVFKNDIRDILNKHDSRVVLNSIRTHMQSGVCMTCPHLGACATTGFHILLKNFSSNETLQKFGCPTIARPLFDAIRT